MRFTLILSFLLLAQLATAQQLETASIKKNVEWLASDLRKGRGTGTPEEKAAAKYIAKHFKKSGLQPKGDKGTYFHQFGFKQQDPHGGEIANAPNIYSQNVAGYLDNGAEYTIVIGAHYDHLGMGDESSMDRSKLGQIHNGADDNASGTAAVMELARYFAKNGVKEKHNFLFLAFSAEEKGLIGSKRFTEYPTIDLSKVSFMINLDMVGRLSQEKKLVVGGVGTAPDFVPLFNELRGDFTVKLDSAGVGPSDHTSFYLKNIPVLFCFTGQHTDYHKPSDDAEKVNFEGIRQISDLLVRAIQRLDNTPKLTFQETKVKESEKISFKVTLGIMPDYAYEGEGVHIDNVTPERPAANAGIQKDDIIIGMGDMPVKTIQDYMKGLSKFKKGESTTVKVKRGDKEISLPVTF